MFRSAVLRCARQASIRASRPITQGVVRPAFSVTRNAAPAASIPSLRFYSAHAGLAKDEVEGRILDLLKNFDKVCTLNSEPKMKADPIVQVNDQSKVLFFEPDTLLVANVSLSALRLIAFHE